MRWFEHLIRMDDRKLNKRTWKELESVREKIQKKTEEMMKRCN
jgi:hypothetical protein